MLTDDHKPDDFPGNTMSTSIFSDTSKYEDLINLFISIKCTKSSITFHSDFIDFRRTLNFKRPLRKTKIDSLLKKCKSKFFRAVQEAVNKLLGISSKVNRLPQSFITNINIDINKAYMQKLLIDIYKEFELSYGSPCNQEKKEMLRALLNQTYQEAFENYVHSNRYEEDVNYIRQREGEKFAILYRYVSKIYVRYYTCSKGNVIRKKKLVSVGPKKEKEESDLDLNFEKNKFKKKEDEEDSQIQITPFDCTDNNKDILNSPMLTKKRIFGIDTFKSL